MKRVRRLVYVSDLSAQRCRGGRTKVYGFTVADIAEVLGETEACIRQRVSRGKLDPTTLRGLFEAMRGTV